MHATPHETIRGSQLVAGLPGTVRDGGRPQRKVFFVCNARDELGGITSWVRRSAELFRQRGHEVQLIGITPGVHPDESMRSLPYPSETLYPGQVPAASGIWGRRAARKAREKAVGRLNDLFRSAPAGSVVVVLQVWAMEWVAEADTQGLLTVGMSHESFEASEASSRFQRVKRYYKNVDRLVLLTDEDADAWAVEGLSHVSAIPNPLPLRAAEPAPLEAKVVTALGRLSHEKGYDLLLDAWAKVTRVAPEWELRIYGSGEEEETLRRQCADLGIDSSVCFAGRTTDVEGVLSASSIVAQASRAEGFPLTLLEAMACGVPCVAANCAPGVREIITDGEDGLLVQPGDVDMLARQLLRLIDDEDLRQSLGRQAFRSALRYDPETITDRWEGLFELLER